MKIGEIERSFDRASANYDDHDALEREVGKRLLQRVEFLRHAPARILDLGCATGCGAMALKHRFEDAEIIGTHVSHGMLRGLRRRSGDLGALPGVQADLTLLPFASRSFDLVYCNLALQWAGDFGHALNGIRRVLRPGGMLLLSVPGPDSLREFRGNSGQGASPSIPIYLPDLRDVGDLLMTCGYGEPVMDCELITLSYPSAKQMMVEFAVTGAAGFAKLPVPRAEDESIEVSFEIVYGAAFGPADGQPIRTAEGEVATFSIDQLRKQ